MNAADYACLVRFQAFPFIHETLKRRPIRLLFEMDVQHPAFQRVITPMVMNNKFAAFCRFLSTAKHHNWMRFPPDQSSTRGSRLDSDARDYEVVEALFWDEPTEALANRLLKTLLHFPHHSFPIIWQTGINLLLRASTAEEKEVALVFLEAFLAA